MGAGIALREDFEAADLRRLAKASKDAGQSRRLLALAEIYDGGRRSDAARIGGVGLQVIRDWVLRFNGEGPNGLIDRKAPGVAPKLNDAQRRARARSKLSALTSGGTGISIQSSRGRSWLALSRAGHASQRTLYGPQRVTDSYLDILESGDSEIGLARV